MLDLDALRFDERGLVPVIAQDATDGRVLMLAYADREALERTIETGLMHYWSRSRAAIWKKGETSGHLQRLASLQPDCDGDTVLARVHQAGPACHTGTVSCFGSPPATLLEELEAVIRERAQDPPEGSYVAGLLEEETRLRRKVGEEAVEVALESDDASLPEEAADLVFHLLVLLSARDRGWTNVLAALAARRREE